MNQEAIRILIEKMPFDEGKSANELLTFFHRGLQLDYLEELLKSDNLEELKCSVWIASELSDKVITLISTIEALLNHSDETVRYYALECFFCCSKFLSPEMLLIAVSKIDDPGSAVRQKAMRILDSLSMSVLDKIAKAENADSHCILLSSILWLIGVYQNKEFGEITKRLDSENRITRITAAIAAKSAFKLAPVGLKKAILSSDENIKLFARRALEDMLDI
jgi:hypothetical protein